MNNKPETLEREFIEKRTVTVEKGGSVGKQWFKTRIKDKEAYQEFREAVCSFAEDERLVTKKQIKKPNGTKKDLLSVYAIGDANVGLLSWKNETGEDISLDSMMEDLTVAMTLLVAKADKSSTALIVDVGDWFHSDNQTNRTNHSGNPLDVDGRYGKVLKAGMKLAVTLIDLALEKHEKVIWRSAIGNHNEHSAIMMMAFLDAWYRNEPRVKIEDSENMFFYMSWGKNLIGITHGHTVKAEKLGEIMAVDCEKQWSESEYRWWCTGHIHHQSVKEFPSCTVETFNTLIGKDAWHSASGYRSRQQMTCITLNKEYGEEDRAIVSLRKVRSGKEKTL